MGAFGGGGEPCHGKMNASRKAIVMANHAYMKLPWGVDSDIMNLFASEAMMAAFGGYFVPEHDEGALTFTQAVSDGGAYSMTTQIWSESSRHVEMRHGCVGLTRVAQALEFEVLGSCFGAPIGSDDGIGDYLLDRPGRFEILPLRSFCDGLNPAARSYSFAKASAKLSKLLSLSIPIQAGADADNTMWLLTKEQQAEAKKMVDPVFFNAPNFDPHGTFKPGPKRDEYLRIKKLDVMDWASKLDWDKAMELAYPQGSGLDAKKAGAALLPSAALGIDCPKSALERSGVEGLERALAVALLWSNAATAKRIHNKLCEVASNPEVSETKAKTQCDKFLAKRAKTTEGDPVPDQAESASALFESLALARHAARAVAGRGKGKNPAL